MFLKFYLKVEYDQFQGHKLWLLSTESRSSGIHLVVLHTGWLFKAFSVFLMSCCTFSLTFKNPFYRMLLSSKINFIFFCSINLVLQIRFKNTKVWEGFYSSFKYFLNASIYSSIFCIRVWVMRISDYIFSLKLPRWSLIVRKLFYIGK